MRSTAAPPPSSTSNLYSLHLAAASAAPSHAQMLLWAPEASTPPWSLPPFPQGALASSTMPPAPSATSCAAEPPYFCATAPTSPRLPAPTASCCLPRVCRLPSPPGPSLVPCSSARRCRTQRLPRPLPRRALPCWCDQQSHLLRSLIAAALLGHAQ